MTLIRNAFSRLHYPVDVIAQCVRGYLAYALTARLCFDTEHGRFCR